MTPTSLMPALAAFFALPMPQPVPALARVRAPEGKVRVRRQTLGLRFARTDDSMGGILAELREAGCHD